MPVAVPIRGYKEPVFCRPQSSDPEVLRQIFVREEYGAVSALPDVNFIVDCGANIGLTSVFLLTRYANARAVVVEPDAANMTLCRKNLERFGERVHYVSAAVWPSQTTLKMKAADGPAKEWGYQVEPVGSGEAGGVRGVTIDDLMREAAFPAIDLLKVDIEGAEVPLFDGPAAAQWLSKTRNLVIEIHGPTARDIVMRAMSDFAYQISHSGELTVFRQIQPRAV
jgi:FkbM family methyltransferase